jgi:hypothetical protein
VSDLIRSLVAHMSELICIYVCFYECDSSSVTSRTGEKDTLGFFENGVLSEEVTRGWRKLRDW